MILACMSSKRPRKSAIITSTVNIEVYIQILDNFSIPPIENEVKDFLKKGISTQWNDLWIIRVLIQLKWLVNYPGLNPIEMTCELSGS